MTGEAEQGRQATRILGRTTGPRQCQMHVRIRLADGSAAQRAGHGRSQVRAGIADDSEQIHGSHPDDRIGTAQAYGREVERGVGPVRRLVQQIPHGIDVTFPGGRTHALQRPVELRRHFVRRRQAAPHRPGRRRHIPPPLRHRATRCVHFVPK